MGDKPKLSEHERRVADVYNLASAGYDKPAVRWFWSLAARLVDLAHVQRGQTVLDVATGTGAAAIPAARRVGPSGRVVGVDIATGMLEQARRNIQAASLTNVELREADAEALPFPGNAFDLVLCSASIFFLPDMGAGLREWKRVVKPSGRVAFSGFGETAFQPLSDLYEARIRKYGVPLPPQKRPFGWQRLTDPDRCRVLLQDVGFEEIHVHTEQLGYHLDTREEWWDIIWGSGFRGPVSQLSPEQLERFKAEHLAEVAETATDRGIWVDVAAIFAIGQKPTNSLS